MAGNELKSHPAILQIFATRIKLEQRDGGFLGLCPFHNDHNPSMSVGKDKEGSWCYFCFSCAAGGDAVKFVQDFDKVTFKEATKVIEETVGGNWEQNKIIVDKAFKPIEFAKIEESTYSLADYFKLEALLRDSPEAQEWLFTKRGITYDTAVKMHFGFKPALPFVQKMEDKSLSSLWDKGWIALPSIEGDQVKCIEYRSLAEKKFVRQKGMVRNCLTGVDNISTSEPLYVVEGKFDLAVMVQAGYRAVSLPSASAKLTPEMRDQIMSASVIILAGDND